MQLSNHLFEELAMDVYDEVDRRETDAGWVKMFRVISLENLQQCCAYNILMTPSSNNTCSVVGNAESQHAGDGDDGGAFPSCESRVFINTEPGTLALEDTNFATLLSSVTLLTILKWLFVLSSRADRSWQGLTHTSLRLWWSTYWATPNVDNKGIQ